MEELTSEETRERHHESKGILNQSPTPNNLQGRIPSSSSRVPSPNITRILSETPTPAGVVLLDRLIHYVPLRASGGDGHQSGSEFDTNERGW
jgi:hypothetical protein